MLVDGVQVTCPKCGHEFRLFEALAQPLLATAVQDRLNAERENLLRDVQTRVADEYATKLKRVEEEISNKYRLQLEERDKIISDTQRQVEELRRRGDIVCVQLKGEVFEQRLVRTLRSAFPSDRIQDIPTGRNGGDAIHEVFGPTGTRCGALLWEAKNTSGWSNQWLTKCREDQHRVHAQASVIVSSALPREVTTFEKVGGVWVCSLECAVPLARALRAAVVAVSMAVTAAQGQGEKDALLHAYVSSDKFAAHITALVEASTALDEGLESEQRYVTRLWAKQHKHIERVMESTATLYGEIQGIVGKAVAEVKGFNMLADSPASGEGAA